MHISKITGINNYRNLSGVSFKFDNEVNFIVGENNIGKTNLIELMHKMIKTGKYEETDFKNLRDPIEVVFTIEYCSDELGFFENTFDIDDEYSITITAKQENVDARIEYCHTESGTYINPKVIKMMNFIYYSSLRSPNKELSFNNSIGTGKVLNFIMKKSLESKDLEQMDLLKEYEVNEVISELNNKLNKLNGLSGEKIEAFLSNDKENIINRLLEIGDANGRSISKLGDGLQYSFNIFLNILELLVHLKTTKKENDFDNLLIVDEYGHKLMPIILGLDEPEIHQHPYRQRALIKSIKRMFMLI
ncbi:MAG: AAA family ATPase [Ignavibacteriales bacterium]|nr:AAA family ATPase [Ignavibacteriales bacterium]